MSEKVLISNNYYDEYDKLLKDKDKNNYGSSSTLHSSSTDKNITKSLKKNRNHKRVNHSLGSILVSAFSSATFFLSKKQS